MRVGDEILVVGIGVSGLTSAIALLESGYQVKIIAREAPKNTTSAIAAAVWFPYKADPPEKVSAWSKQTFEAYRAHAGMAETGVSWVTTQLLFKAEEPDPWWLDAVYRFRRLPSAELPPCYADGYTIDAPLIETPKYLPFLAARFHELGGVFQQREVKDLAELLESYPLVVNCTGLGAAALLNDREMFPIRGQILRVQAPEIKQVRADDSDLNSPFYVIPRSEDCILGGSADKGNWNLAADEQLSQQILAGCIGMEPAAARARILETLVGLRPGRTSVRLELESYGEGRSVIHNYGHGGSGYTICWGCAAEVKALAENLVKA